MPLSYGSIAGNLSSCIQHPSTVLPTTAWFAHVRSRSFSGGALAAPVPRQQVMDALGGMIRQAGQHVGEPGLRIDAVSTIANAAFIDRFSSVRLEHSCRFRDFPAMRE